MQGLRLKLGAEAEAIPGFLLWQVSKLWQRHLTLALQDLKLPSTQAVILANVLRFTEEGRPATQAALAEVAKVDQMTASQSLQSLERKGYITRRTSSGDRRANQVLVTTTGRRVAQDAIKRLAATHTAFFSPLAGQTAAIVSYMQKLIKANDLR